jgi:dipeptidyl aminopeptidase/acylaminoacyl peptidase
MTKTCIARCLIAVALGPAGLAAQQPAADTLSLERALGYPYPSDLVAAAKSGRIAWVFNQQGRRNIWTADAPDYRATQLTHYTVDDGQELTELSVTADGNTVVYVRGGDHDANWSEDIPPNPLSGTAQPKVAIWAVGAHGGDPRLLADGDDPVVSPRGDRVVFTRAGQLWVVATDGSAPARQLFYARGTSGSATWSPDGSRLAFVSDRGDHSFVGLYVDDSIPVRWMAPSTSQDGSPVWSPDGRSLAFARAPGNGGPPRPFLTLVPQPWSIWIADAATGAAHAVWSSPATLRGSFPETDGEANLHWAAGDRLTFLADLDGWPHLYSIATSGGAPLLLTPGAFMAEFIAMSPDRRTLVYAANTGADSNDVDRRHIFSVPVDRAEPRGLTAGVGVEWTPVFTGDGQSVAYIGAGTATPPLPAVIPAAGGTPRSLGSELIAEFPAKQFVTPRKVVFRSADGTMVHGQLFERPGGAPRKGGIVFVHGGPPRQMLLGWHYMDYYSNAYAVNQYLASQGYVVLTVNYRMGIGYGHEFHHPEHAGPAGSSEYQDVKAAGEYLRALPQVDPARVGIWGGSYGGLLTALALARNSDIFKTGVDLHGVHDWPGDLGLWQTSEAARPYEPSDSKAAMVVAWQSSPVADIAKWTSPVLLIQGDDDRNVHFHQTVDLARRLQQQGVRYEELVLPDEIHGFLRHASWLTADSATVAWFRRELAPTRP